MKTATTVIVVAALALGACSESTAPPVIPSSAAATAMHQAQPWPLPVDAAAQPDLAATADGRLLLSWIELEDAETQGAGHALRFATFADGAWSDPRTIARGDDWFVNWADTPHIAVTDDGALWAHWLQKSAAATYAYDVALVRSDDGGASWSPPVLVNDDGTPTEHGFVSLWPASRDRLGIAWLDGRESGAGGHADGAHAGHAAATGAMTLRAASFDAALRRSGETRIDAMVCDCCQTDTALTARGPLLVYRDRSAAEIRDIAATRFEHGRWSSPRSVHADRWTMPACPVNGPSVAARGNEAVVAWYTAGNDTPTLKLARSVDAGDSFAAPLTLDSGPQVQGRVDVAFGDDAVWVLWLREGTGGQSLQLVRLATDLSRELQRIEVARLRGRGRGTGFPQLALSGDVAHVVWTDVIDGAPRLHAARIGVATDR